jgi:hypothetical protein
MLRYRPGRHPYADGLRGSQCLFKLCCGLSGLEIDDEPLPRIDRECRLTLREAEFSALPRYRFAELLRVLLSSGSSRSVNTDAQSAFESNIFPFGKLFDIVWLRRAKTSRSVRRPGLPDVFNETQAFNHRNFLIASFMWVVSTAA